MKLLGDKAIIVGFEDFELPEGVEVMGCPATSTEHLDKYREMGIEIVDLKDETEFLETVTSTAEHTIGLMLALARNYKTALHSPYKDRDSYRGCTLSGKKLGIIGYGRIGKQVAKIALSTGAKVTRIDTDTKIYKIRDRKVGSDVSVEKATLPHFLSLGHDFVSVHIPLVGNEGFFTKEMFKQMKPTAYFINTSRSGIVEKGALLWALKSDTIKGAAVDFIDDPELLEYEKNHDNLILTNHLGGCTHEDQQKTEEFIINKVNKWLLN